MTNSGRILSKSVNLRAGCGTLKRQHLLLRNMTSLTCWGCGDWNKNLYRATGGPFPCNPPSMGRYMQSTASSWRARVAADTPSFVSYWWSARCLHADVSSKRPSPEAREGRAAEGLGNQVHDFVPQFLVGEISLCWRVVSVCGEDWCPAEWVREAEGWWTFPPSNHPMEEEQQGLNHPVKEEQRRPCHWQSASHGGVCHGRLNRYSSRWWCRQ